MIKDKRITIIGSGKLAWSLIPALKETGINIEFILSKDSADAREAAVKFGIPIFSEQMNDLPVHSHIYMLCVPDDEIQSVSEQAAEKIGDLRDKIFVHFSGALSSGIMKSVIKKEGIACSFHIMQTFPSRQRIPIKNSYAAIEASDESGIAMLSQLASELGLHYFIISSSRKTEYHMAGVFASNFFVSNLFAAEELFKRTGSEINFYDFILPIIKRTIDNSVEKGALNAISGPADRGDMQTIRRHVEALKNDKTFLQSYIAQSIAIIDMKDAGGSTASFYSEIKNYLLEELKKLE